MHCLVLDQEASESCETMQRHLGKGHTRPSSMLRLTVSTSCSTTNCVYTLCANLRTLRASLSLTEQTATEDSLRVS